MLNIDLRGIVISSVTNKALFESIRSNPVVVLLLPEILTELFKRRGKEASLYQNSLLGSWLKHWATSQKLSFINNFSDKLVWRRLMDAALRDPESSYEHKIRCALFLNKLFPNTDDMTPSYRQLILSEISNKRIHFNELKAFITEFTPAEIEQIYNALVAQLSDKYWYVSRSDISPLAAIAAYLPNEKLDEIVKIVLGQLYEGWDDLIRTSVSVLNTVAPHLTANKLDELVTIFINRSKMTDAIVQVGAVSALGGVVPHLGETKLVPVVALLLNHLSNEFCHVRKEAVSALGRAAPHLTKSKLDEIVDPILKCLADENSDVRASAVFALGRIVPHLAKSKVDQMIEPLMKRLRDVDGCVRVAALSVLGSVATQFTDKKLDEIVQSILNSLRDEKGNVREGAVSAFSAIASQLSEPKLYAIASPLLRQLDTRAPEARAVATTALGSVVAHLLKTEDQNANAALTSLLRRLRDLDLGVQKAAVSALGRVAYLSEPKRGEIFLHLLNRLKIDRVPDITEAVTQVLNVLIPYLSDEQLGIITLMPTGNRMERITLKSIAQSRLNLNHPQIDLERDYGVYFSRRDIGSRSDNGMITQHQYNRMTETWDEPRKFRLWSQDKGERRAADDCMTQVAIRRHDKV